MFFYFENVRVGIIHSLGFLIASRALCESEKTIKLSLECFNTTSYNTTSYNSTSSILLVTILLVQYYSFQYY